MYLFDLPCVRTCNLLAAGEWERRVKEMEVELKDARDTAELLEFRSAHNLTHTVRLNSRMS